MTPAPSALGHRTFPSGPHPLNRRGTPRTCCVAVCPTCMKQDTKHIEREAIRLTSSRKVHPENLRVGDYVAIASVTYEIPSFLWCGLDHIAYPPDQTIDIAFTKSADENAPLLVKSVCLPFVLCKSVDGDHRLIDLRRTALLKLDNTFGQEAAKSLTKKSKSKSSGKCSDGSGRKKGKRKKKRR